MSTGDESSGSADGDRLLVAEYALGLLDAVEHERLSQRLAIEPELRRELSLWRLRLSSLDDEFAEAPAPAGVLERVEARLFPSAATPRRVGLWESLAFWRGLAAAGFAVAVVAVGFNLFVPRPLPTGEELVAALEAEGSSLKLVAFYDQRAGTVRIAALSGAAVPGKDYELWAIRGASPAVSMGVIPVDSKSDIRLTDALKRDLAPGTVLAVTLEPKGGSPTGVATGPIVAKGVAIPI
jgi:anti-sigma-K factor RskA